MRILAFAAIAALLCPQTAAAASGATPTATTAPLSAGATVAKPLRRLVYNFTWGTTTDVQSQTAGFADFSAGSVSSGTGVSSQGAPSGMVDSTAGSQDQGTITVDVLREQADKGLVVQISEQARGRRSADPAICVTYGNTNVICDPNRKVNAEELTLLRLLGTTFVDPTQVDADGHWQVRQDAPQEATVSDFTISHNNKGKMTIDESRTVKGLGAHPYTRTGSATIGYDFGHTVPTSVVNSSIERSMVGNNYDVVKSDTSLQLQSDSLVSAANP
ncbi:MAG TPA: hypothetical protein VNG31_01010 [Candidatus Baltobacteraceae bacterium]|nr:hypothetical protein [Candidatus Baltobacteraceae bacterium]